MVCDERRRARGGSSSDAPRDAPPCPGPADITVARIPRTDRVPRARFAGPSFNASTLQRSKLQPSNAELVICDLPQGLSLSTQPPEDTRARTQTQNPEPRTQKPRTTEPPRASALRSPSTHAFQQSSSQPASQPESALPGPALASAIWTDAHREPPPRFTRIRRRHDWPRRVYPTDALQPVPYPLQARARLPTGPIQGPAWPRENCADRRQQVASLAARSCSSPVVPLPLLPLPLPLSLPLPI